MRSNSRLHRTDRQLHAIDCVPRRRRIDVYLVAAALTFVTLACGETPAAPEPFGRVVLVTIDTLRADHLGAYGYPRDTSPFLDGLAEEGVRFDRAFAQTGTTQPSHAAMFTGLYPIQTGVLRNGHSLAEEFVTLAELMREAGYTTAAFTSTNAHFSWGGLTQGLDVYDELGEEGGDLYRPADETVDTAMAWLDERPASERLFLWIHLFDPHRPFNPPARHLLKMMPRGLPQVRALADMLEREHSLNAGPDGLDDTLVRRIGRYDAEIAFADEQVQRLHAWLQARGFNEDALWVVTADHGQGLQNHGWFGHSKQIYNEQLRVPLILWSADGRLGRHEVVERVVEHVDLTPTLAELAGVKRSLAGQPEPVQGQSLLPLLGGEGRYTKRYAFGMRSSYPRRRPDAAPLLRPGGMFAIQDDRYKLLLYTEGDDELYDLAEDPYETVNLAGELPDVAALFRDELAGMIDRLRSGRSPRPIDLEGIERLRDLGYIQ